jgi:hypothetical protein
MKSKIYIITILIILVSCRTFHYRTENIPNINESIETEIQSIYNNTKLADKLDYKIFRMAMVGFYNIDVPKKNIISIIDYSQPSVNKRYYLIDLENQDLLFNTLIAHGKNSGENMARVFSNVPESKTSSIGFFITAETYEGSNGYSLRIDGIEKGINHNARKRDIVIHKADYVSQEFIDQEGRLGRSWGCPAFPNEVSNLIIEIIKDGSCIFVYGEDVSYFQNSKYIEKNQ